MKKLIMSIRGLYESRELEPKILGGHKGSILLEIRLLWTENLA